MAAGRLGTRLKVARAERGLSQQQLAMCTDVTRQTISAIETELRCPSTLPAFVLAEKLDKHFDEPFFLTYGLLVHLTYRSLARQEAAWDLLALVFIGGTMSAIHQARRKSLPSTWSRKGLLVAGIGAAVAALALVLLALARVS